MALNEREFLQRLLATFKAEADEHLKTMSGLMLALEEVVPDERRAELIETLFREAHSLKGAARSVNQQEIESACKELETVLAGLKRGEKVWSNETFERLYRMVDELAQLTGGQDGQQPVAAELPPVPVIPAVPAIPAAPAGTDLARPAPTLAPTQPQAPAAEPAGGATVRIATAKLGALLTQAESLLAFKFGASHLAAELMALKTEFAAWKRDRDEGRLKALEARLVQLTRTSSQERHEAASLVDGLLDDIKAALMLPFASLFELLPKLVRDQAKFSGKEVELRISGAAIEIDRRILEQMKDPLIHLVRNALDHGIETPGERRLQGKPARARLDIKVSPRDGNKIELEVSDDGAGISLARLRFSAERQGRPLPEDSAPRSAWYELLFESGFSTSPIITDLSGRGLGLAIVREKVEKLGGQLTIESEEGGGTRFCIILPTTLATFRGLLVRASERRFVLPSAQVERALRVAPSAVRTVENRETIELAGQALALVWLAEVLELPSRRREGGQEFLYIVVVCAAGKRIGFVVDEVVADQEVLVKSLGPQLRRVRNIAGATVLGAGTVVPILNPPDLIKAAMRLEPGVPAEPAPVAEAKSLLVAEDSITARALLKGILEANGYRVATAVDGMEALAALRAGQFDLLVSDVEMPRMDGFELTARIRQEPRLKELPVVLVTALESAEDRSRGIDVGADAYIVKSSFDQSNLLEVIGRLV
jgi:two-component system chemotaxis sensor kinase CheA